MNEPQGRKEVCEAVLIAALAAVCTSLINFGADELKKHVAKKQEKKAEPEAEEVTP